MEEGNSGGLTEGDVGGVGSILQSDLESIFGDVRIECYRQQDRLGVHVEPTGVKRELEERYPDITVAPYSDFKFTASLPD